MGSPCLVGSALQTVRPQVGEEESVQGAPQPQVLVPRWDGVGVLVRDWSRAGCWCAHRGRCLHSAHEGGSGPRSSLCPGP